jgi:ElaB/YqjD/DUF883 family membrane-anchored ribosome-binding protein
MAHRSHTGQNQLATDARAIADDARNLVGDAASAAYETAKDAATAVGQKAGAMAAAVGVRADDMTAAVGGQIQSLARNAKKKLPRKGLIGRASAMAADKLQSGGRYLEKDGLGGMAHDASELIRRNPMTSVLAGIGIGFLIGRTIEALRHSDRG